MSGPYEQQPLRSFIDNPRDIGGYALSDFLIVHEFNYARHQPTFQELEPFGTKIIDMNEAGHVVAAADEKQRISTYGLGGCTAIGVVATFPDGSRRAHVQHYDTFRKRMDSRQLSLEEMILAQEAEQGRYSTANKVDAVIMIPGGGSRMEPDDPAHAGWLTETLKKEFGEATTVVVAPYSTTKASGENYYVKALVIDVPAQGSPTIFPGTSRIQTEQQ